MSIITTYVCDVSGVNSNNIKDFYKVNLRTVEADKSFGSYNSSNWSTDKLVHKDVATRLGIINVTIPKDEPAPVVLTIESQITVLLRDLVDEAVADAMENRG